MLYLTERRNRIFIRKDGKEVGYILTKGNVLTTKTYKIYPVEGHTARGTGYSIDFGKSMERTGRQLTPEQREKKEGASCRVRS